MGRGLARSPPAAGQWETLMPGRLATLSPGVAPQRGLLSLSHEVRTINPFKSLLPLPPGCREEGWARSPWLGCLALSRASVLLSDLCRLRTHRPLPRGMRSSCWQQQYRLASGLGCGKAAPLVVLTGVVIFSEVLSGDSLSHRCGPDALAWHQVVRKQKPPDNHGPTVATELCLKVLQDASSREVFLWTPGSSLGFPGGTSGKEPACQCRKHELDPWVGKIPWRRAWQPTSVFLPGESHGQEPGGLLSVGSHRVRME